MSNKSSQFCFLKLFFSFRQASLPLFKKNNLHNYTETIFPEKTAILLKVLENAEKNCSEINIKDLFSGYTLECFCKIAFDVDLPSITTDVPFQHHYDAAIKFMADVYVNPMTEWFQKNEYKKHIQVIDETLYQFIDKSVHSGEDLLSKLLAARDKDGKPFSKKWIRDILANFLIAGRDTTSELLTWTFYLLAKNPRVENKLIEEIKHEINGKVSTESLARCKYLDMVINETLRYYPSVPITGRWATRDVTLPSGVKVLRGDFLFYSQYYLHRDPTVWDKHDQYFPERWEDKQLLSSKNFLPFHSGEMQCIGRHMAKIEAKALIAAILNEYHLTLVPGQKIEPFFGFILSSPCIKMNVKKREI